MGLAQRLSPSSPSADPQTRLPRAPSVTGAWRVFKTRSNFLPEAVDKSAQKLDKASRFRDPTAQGSSPTRCFAPDRRGRAWVKHSSLSYVQVASGLGQMLHPPTRSAASLCSCHVPRRCLGLPQPRGSHPHPTSAPVPPTLHRPRGSQSRRWWRTQTAVLWQLAPSHPLPIHPPRLGQCPALPAVPRTPSGPIICSCFSSCLCKGKLPAPGRHASPTDAQPTEQQTHEHSTKAFLPTIPKHATDKQCMFGTLAASSIGPSRVHSQAQKPPPPGAQSWSDPARGRTLSPGEQPPSSSSSNKTTMEEAKKKANSAHSWDLRSTHEDQE